MNIGNNLKSVWAEIEKGAQLRKHPFHIANLAYKHIYAETCSVVLQAVDIDHGRIRFHTHIGANKVKAFKQDPRISMMVYAPTLKLQVRLRGVVAMHHQDEETKAIWNSMRDSSKQCYQLPAPGGEKLLENSHQYTPDLLQQQLIQNPKAGYESFMVCWLVCDELDVLELNYEGHERMRYVRASGEDNWTAKAIQA